MIFRFNETANDFFLAQVLMGLLQLGFVSIFLSEPMVSGYTVGAAVLALTSQLQSMTGLGGVVKVHQGSLKAVKVRVISRSIGPAKKKKLPLACQNALKCVRTWAME